MSTLELLVLIGVQTLKFVMQVAYKIIFTDSLYVLHWLQSKKPLLPSLKEIKTLNGVACLQNRILIDLITRRKPPEELSSVWRNDPSWLSQLNQQ